MKWIFFALIFLPSSIYASGIYNPGSSVAISTSAVSPGSTNYIQNTLAPSTTSQVFSVQQGKYAYPGFIMTDVNSCTWDTKITIQGAIITALISCPSSGMTGQCIGMLCGVTYAQ